MKAIIGVVSIAAMGFSLPAWSWTGNDLVRWEIEYNRGATTWSGGLYLGYIAGIAEFTNGILFCAPPGATQGQNAAIVSKYLKNNPEQWTDSASTIVLAALQSSYPDCKPQK